LRVYCGALKYDLEKIARHKPWSITTENVLISINEKALYPFSSFFVCFAVKDTKKKKKLIAAYEFAAAP